MVGIMYFKSPITFLGYLSNKKGGLEKKLTRGSQHPEQIQTPESMGFDHFRAYALHYRIIMSLPLEKESPNRGLKTHDKA